MPTLNMGTAEMGQGGGMWPSFSTNLDTALGAGIGYGHQPVEGQQPGSPQAQGPYGGYVMEETVEGSQQGDGGHGSQGLGF